MRRHRADLVSLIAGLLFLAFGLGAMFSDAQSAHDTLGLAVDARWMGPVLLVALGALGLAASVRRPENPVEMSVSAAEASDVVEK